MTDIDLATGLPELPDGHYWRLDKHSVSIRRRLPDTEWCKQYQDDWGMFITQRQFRIDSEQSKWETKTVIERVETKVRIDNWWSWKEEYATVIKNAEVTYERFINRSEEVVNVPTAYTGETKTVYGFDHYTGTHYPHGSYGSGIETYQRTPDKIVKLREVLTRDNVLTLCEKALKELDGLTLQGDYPPKRFERD